MRGRRTPAIRRCHLAQYRGAVVLNPADKVRSDRAAREAEYERRAEQSARRLELKKANDPNACSICGRRISAPASLERGTGPVCDDRARHRAQEEAF